jgi:putative ATPase
MSIPLAERLRPRNLDEFIGQTHLVGKGAVLRKMIDSAIPSFLGPQGVGKKNWPTSSQTLEAPFYNWAPSPGSN